MDGAYDWRLYYMGVGRDGEASVGMAYSEGQALQKFDKCDAVLVKGVEPLTGRTSATKLIAVVRLLR
jgi:hypothetical protein